jgi:tetratricopeptide (TPR) repeat protein
MPGSRRPIALLWLIACFSPAPTLAEGIWTRIRSPEAPEIATYREAAHRALEEQQPALASRAALEAIRRSPNSADAYVLLGHARALAGDHQKAADAYEHALSLAPDALDHVRDASWASRAATHAERWELAAHALRTLTTRLARVPARTLAFSRLGDVLQALGPSRLDEAIVAYRHALLDARGFLPSACIGLALALSRAGHADEARGWVHRALERTSVEELLDAVTGPASERLARRALIASSHGERAEAARLFRESAAQSPHRDHALREASR